MKIDKQTQKILIAKVKEIAINEGYKTIQNTIYKMDNINVIFIDYLVLNSEYLSYRINIKKKSYDNIFWRIMRMEENIKGRETLGINAAFSAPPVLIKKGMVKLSEHVDLIAESFLEEIDKELKSFLQKNDIEEYIFSGAEILDLNILKCLSYIDLDIPIKAKEIAENQLRTGDRGRFENGGKGFFELVLLYVS